MLSVQMCNYKYILNKWLMKSFSINGIEVYFRMPDSI